MQKFQHWRHQIAELCDEAANGLLTIEQFYARWPEDLCKQGIAQLIYEDLEDGVQHFPGKLFSALPDYESWKSSEMYKRIIVDREILKLDQSEDQLIELRHSLLADKL
jgi:hypothetical protein